MKRDKSWLQKQVNDRYVKQAHKDSYRSRAIYKLEEIDKRDRLFKPGQTVVDLGAAPGSWTQYASERIQPGGKIIAVDILDMPPIGQVNIIKGDLSDPKVYEKCRSISGEHQVDLVISDLAPNLTGIRATDQARSMYLAELVLDFANEVLSAHGTLLIKLFQGQGIDEYRIELNKKFQKLMVRKPKASRDSSREFYILARGYTI